jgi:hypothetical protein
LHRGTARGALNFEALNFEALNWLNFRKAICKRLPVELHQLASRGKEKERGSHRDLVFG